MANLTLRAVVLEGAKRHLGEVLDVEIYALRTVRSQTRGTLTRAEGSAEYLGLTYSVVIYEGPRRSEMHLENGRSKMYFPEVNINY